MGWFGLLAFILAARQCPGRAKNGPKTGRNCPARAENSPRMANPGQKMLAKAMNLSFFQGWGLSGLVWPLSIYLGCTKKSGPGQKWPENGSKMSGPARKQPENDKIGPKEI